jgi:hypothetical protein
VNLVPTELNQRLANAVRYSVAADRFYITGKAGFWRFVGVGLVTFCLGCAVGIGFYGYSYVTRNSDTLDILSSAFSKALSEVRLRATAEGMVRLEPREIALAKGQTISLDTNSRLLLDPSAKVLADGELKIQIPSATSPQGTTPRSTSKAITNFTVFKSVPFERGLVKTGWNFITSSQKTPTNQYCYYSEKLESPGSNLKVDIGTDRQMKAPKSLPKDFDIAAAFSKCVWFKSEIVQ